MLSPQQRSQMRAAIPAIGLSTACGWLRSLLDHAAEMDASATVLLDENERLRKSVLNIEGDNECWVTNAGAFQLPPRAEFLESCSRFHAQLASERGELVGCKTIAELEAENERLRCDTWCDVCSGTGKVPSGKPCLCGGTGRCTDALVEMRRLYFAEESENELRRYTEDQAIQYGARMEEQKERLEAENAALRESAQWKPIAEIHEDLGSCVLMRLDDPGYMGVGNNLDLDFNEQGWTHFVQVPKLTHEEAAALAKADALTGEKP